MNNMKCFLEQGHRVMSSNDGYNWELTLYCEEDVCFYFDGIATSFKYIVPIEQFDFKAENITTNINQNIN